MSRGSCLKKCDAAPSGWMAEQTSWTNPGSVSSADLEPPPTVAAASSTSTERPDRAISTAAARPFGPDPTTTASYCSPLGGGTFPGSERFGDHAERCSGKVEA